MISHDHGCFSILAEHTCGTSGSYESLDEASGSTGKEAAVLQPELSEEAGARQPGEELRRLRGEAASRGLDWLGRALAEIGRDQLREMSKCILSHHSVSAWVKQNGLRLHRRAIKLPIPFAHIVVPGHR